MITISIIIMTYKTTCTHHQILSSSETKSNHEIKDRSGDSVCKIKRLIIWEIRCGMRSALCNFRAET